MLHTNIRVRWTNGISVVIALVLMALSAQQAGAAPVSVNESTQLTNECALEGDAEYRESRNYWACCSKTLGYCIVCRKGEVNGQCDKRTYRGLIRLFGWQEMAPGSQSEMRVAP